MRQVVLLSNGRAGLVDLLGLTDWPGALALLDADGPNALIARVRAAEAPVGRADRRRHRRVDRLAGTSTGTDRFGSVSAGSSRPGLEEPAHPALGVEPREDGVADRASWASWVGGESVDDVVARGLDVSRGRRDDRLPPASVSRALVARPSSGQGKRSTRPAVLEPPHHMRQPGERGVGALGERGHPQGALGRLRQHREDEVLEVGELGVAAQLGVEDAGKQLDHCHQPDPRGQLVGRRASAFHAISLAN